MEDQIQFSEDGFTIAGYYFPFLNSKKILFHTIKRCDVSELNFSNGRFRIWGMGTSPVWFNFDRHRSQKKKLFIFDLGGRVKVGVTPADPLWFAQQLRLHWIIFDHGTKDDWPQIQSLLATEVSEFETAADIKKNQYYVAKHQTDVIAVLQWARHQTTAVITILALHPEIKNSDVGQKLFWALVDHLADRWFKDLIVVSDDDKFWEELGLEKMSSGNLKNLGPNLTPLSTLNQSIFRKSIAE